MNVSNPELQLAEEFVRDTNCHIFLTGKAGTGKTTFLQTVKAKTGKRAVVTAPTGVAAINAGGVTLHSFFQLPFGPFLPGGAVHTDRHRIRQEKKNIIRSLDLLVIDEISMVRADLLDGVDSVLRHYRRSDEPFGGVQLLMIGDLHQLSPVAKQAEWQLLQEYYASPYFFSSAALGRTELVTIELRHIYRQTDPDFIELLGRVRDNRLDAETLRRLNARYIPDVAPGDGTIILCTHNSGADAINAARLKALKGQSRLFEAETVGDFPEYAYPAAASLEVKIGAQVMFVRNDMSAEKAYFNGKIGTVTGLGRDAIEVSCPGETEPIAVEKTVWENIEYAIDRETAEISRKVIGTFRQYPLKPAWAITIHKSQGLTFDKAVIDAKAAFAHGQVYVALSRCRSLDGLVLGTPLTLQAVKTDPVVRRFADAVSDRTPSAQTLASAKNRYQQHLLLECFTFEHLRRALGRMAGLLRGNANVIQVSGRGDIEKIQRKTTEEICEVGEKFKRQLQGLFAGDRLPSDDPAIRDRLDKAAGYFEEKFATVLSPWLDTVAVESDNKEIRKSITDALKRLREESAVKLAGVLACREGFSPERYLWALATASLAAGQPRPKARSVTYTEADVGHPELFEALRQWRRDKAAEEGVAHYQILHQKTLVQIAVHLPATLTDLMQIKGIGRRLAARYGEELLGLVTDYRRRHGIEMVALPAPAAPAPRNPQAVPAYREDTKQTSFALFREGLTVREIAARRGLRVVTIEDHLAFFVTRGEVPIDRLVADDRRRAIEEKVAVIGTESLKALKTALGDDCTYGEIKMVLAHLACLSRQ